MQEAAFKNVKRNDLVSPSRGKQLVSESLAKDAVTDPSSDTNSDVQEQNSRARISFT